MLTARTLTAVIDVLEAGAKGVLAADRAFSLLPGYSRLRGRVLDTVLGPEDDEVLVPRTTPKV